MALGFTGGLAAADGYHDRDRVTVDVHARAGGPRRVEEIHYRDFHHRPAVRVERHDFRRGFIWVGGEWMWRGGEWMWAPGHYVRR